MAFRASAHVVGRLRGASVGDWLRLAVVGCAGLAVALGLLAHAQAPSPGRARTLIGHAAPPFTAPATQGGRTLAQPASFDGRSGRLTLLVFFDTLCVHCVAGVQAADALARTPALPPLDIIYLDAPGENAEITGHYMERLGITTPVLLDRDARIAARYGVTYYPSFVLIDTRNVIRAVWLGAPTLSDLRATITRAR